MSSPWQQQQQAGPPGYMQGGAYSQGAQSQGQGQGGAPPPPPPPPPPASWNYARQAQGGPAPTQTNNSSSSGAGGSLYPPAPAPPPPIASAPVSAPLQHLPNTNYTQAQAPAGAASSFGGASLGGGDGYAPPPPPRSGGVGGALRTPGRTFVPGEPFRATRAPSHVPGRPAMTPMRRAMGQQQQMQQGQLPPPPPAPPVSAGAIPSQSYGHPPPPPQQTQQYPQQQHMQNAPLPPPPPPPQGSSHAQYPPQPPPPPQNYPQPPQGYPQPPPPQQQQTQQTQQPRSQHPPPRIDPSQIPRIPCHTKPHSLPATPFLPREALQLAIDGHTLPTSTSTTTTTSTIRKPPEAYERYVTMDDGNCPPTHCRTTVHGFPLSKKVRDRSGLPLALVVTPFAPVVDAASMNTGGGGGRGYEERYQEEEKESVGVGVKHEAAAKMLGPIPVITSRSSLANKGDKLTASPHSFTHDSKSLSNSNKNDDENDGPIRCRHCACYLNPFVTTIQPVDAIRGTFSFRCNFCQTRNDVQKKVVDSMSSGGYSETDRRRFAAWGAAAAPMPPPAPAQQGQGNSPRWSTLQEEVDTCTRFAIVDFVVGGKFVVRSEEETRRSVFLYAVDVASYRQSAVVGSQGEEKERGDEDEEDGMEMLRVTLQSIRQVASMLALEHAERNRRAQQQQQGGGGDTEARFHPRVGLFLYDGSAAYFPHWKTSAQKVNNSEEDEHNNHDQSTPETRSMKELELVVVADVHEDPFCPLPIDALSYDVTCNKAMADMDAALEYIPLLLKQDKAVVSAPSGSAGAGAGAGAGAPRPLVPGAPPPPPSSATAAGVGGAEDVASAGGAAIQILADALAHCGGKGTLLTPHRPTVGLGALRDRRSHVNTGFGPQRSNKVGGEVAWLPLQYAAKFQAKKKKSSSTTSSSASSGASGGGVDVLHKQDAASAAFYSKLAETCSANSVSIDVMILKHPPRRTSSEVNEEEEEEERYYDAATLGEFCRITCGTIHVITLPPNRTSITCQSSPPTRTRLTEELLRSASSHHGAMGQDALFKLRCSDGVKVKKFIGLPPGVVVQSDPMGTLLADESASSELEMASVGVNTCICLQLDHRVGGIKAAEIGGDPCTYMQSAILYTDPVGQRRVRVLTLAVKTTAVLHDVFRSADYSTAGAVIARQACEALYQGGVNKDDAVGGLEVARKWVVGSCVEVLTCYRMYTTARKSPAGQLILPETLQLLPIFCLSLRKSHMLRPLSGGVRRGASSSSGWFGACEEDERPLHAYIMAQVQPDLATMLVHPSMYRLDRFSEGEGDWFTPTLQQQQHHQQHAILHGRNTALDTMACRPYVRLSPTVHPTMSCLQDDGIYILDDGMSLYVYVGRDVAEDVQLEIFGDVAMDQGASGGTYEEGLLESTSEFARQVRNVVHELRVWSAARPTFAPLVVMLATQPGQQAVHHYHHDAGAAGGGNEQKPGSFVTSLENERRLAKLATLLVDDPTVHEKGYVDFLCMIHRQIKNAISQDEDHF